MSEPFHAQSDFIAIKHHKDEVAVNGIIMENNAGYEKGKVVSAGDKCRYIRNGMNVFYNKAMTEYYTYKGIEYLLVRECDLLGVEDEQA